MRNERRGYITEAPVSDFCLPSPVLCFLLQHTVSHSRRRVRSLQPSRAGTTFFFPLLYNTSYIEKARPFKQHYYQEHRLEKKSVIMRFSHLSSSLLLGSAIATPLIARQQSSRGGPDFTQLGPLPIVGDPAQLGNTFVKRTMDGGEGGHGGGGRGGGDGFRGNVGQGQGQGRGEGGPRGGFNGGGQGRNRDGGGKDEWSNYQPGGDVVIVSPPPQPAEQQPPKEDWKDTPQPAEQQPPKEPWKDTPAPPAQQQPPPPPSSPPAAEPWKDTPSPPAPAQQQPPPPPPPATSPWQNMPGSAWTDNNGKPIVMPQEWSDKMWPQIVTLGCVTPFESLKLGVILEGVHTVDTGRKAGSPR